MAVTTLIQKKTSW